MSTEYLKDSYKWQIRTFTLFNAALFWTLAVSGEDVSTLPTLFSGISVKDGLVASVAPIICFLIDGLLSPDAKSRLVYWRWHHPLPGSRAFSKHLKADPRADPERLVRDWGQLPDQPDQENILWYKIYRSVEHDVRVHESHRVWLYAQHLTAYAALFLSMMGTTAVVLGTPLASIVWYVPALAVQYLATMIAARKLGVRFVRTVLAVASTSEPIPTAQSKENR